MQRPSVYVNTRPVQQTHNQPRNTGTLNTMQTRSEELDISSECRSAPSRTNRHAHSGGRTPARPFRRAAASLCIWLTASLSIHSAAPPPNVWTHTTCPIHGGVTVGPLNRVYFATHAQLPVGGNPPPIVLPVVRALDPFSIVSHLFVPPTHHVECHHRRR